MLELWLQPVDQASLEWAKANSFVLDENEAQRWQRYVSGETRELFVVAHVVTRHVLSHYDSRTPDAWKFDLGDHGRPEIVDAPHGLRFNISHTDGMVAVLVHGLGDCGVDIENTWQSMDMRSVSRQVFTNAERDSIFSLPPAGQADRFYQLWTLKEALIKAKGKGLTLPLRNFSFALGDGQIEFACDVAIDLEPDQWQFTTHRPESGHIVSVAALRAAGDDDMPVVIRQLVIADQSETALNPAAVQRHGLMRHCNERHLALGDGGSKC